MDPFIPAALSFQITVGAFKSAYRMTAAEKKEVSASYLPRVQRKRANTESITFRTPIVFDGDMGNKVYISFPDENVTVETVVSLVRKNPDMYVDFKIDLDEQDLTASEAHPTFEGIKAYIQKEYGVKVSSLYISQVKRKLGLAVGESFNNPKSENVKQPQCPPDKEKMIMAALKHFKMI